MVRIIQKVKVRVTTPQHVGEPLPEMNATVEVTFEISKAGVECVFDLSGRFYRFSMSDTLLMAIGKLIEVQPSEEA